MAKITHTKWIIAVLDLKSIIVFFYTCKCGCVRGYGFLCMDITAFQRINFHTFYKVIVTMFSIYIYNLTVLLLRLKFYAILIQSIRALCCQLDKKTAFLGIQHTHSHICKDYRYSVCVCA